MPQESYAIHRSACNRDSRNFAFPEFSEVGTEVRLVASCLLWRGISRCRCSASRLLLTSSRKGVQINPQTIARVTGVLFLITYVTSIPAFFILYAPVLGDPRYIVGAGADNSVRLGAFLEVILIISNIGTAVVLWPVLKRVNEILALGFVTARVMESVFIAVGILSLLSVVALRQEAAGVDADSLVAV